MKCIDSHIRQSRRWVAAMMTLAICCWVLTSLGADSSPITLNLPASCSGEEIQAALDRLHDGGEVDLAPGTYQIRQPIILRHSRQTLHGSGSNTILLLTARANCPVVILGAPGITPRHPTAYLRLADLSIDGNRTNQQMELWHSAVDGSLLNNNGIDVWNVVDSTIEHVICAHCRSGGLVTAAGTRRLVVRDFTAFDNQYDGLACYLTEDSHFTKLFLHNNLAAGISVDLAFNHNFVEDAVLEGNDLGIFMRHSCDNSFKGLTILKSRRHGVFMAQADELTPQGWKPLPGTQCVGNKFTDVQISDCGGRNFLINDNSCTNNVIIEVRAPVKRQPGPMASSGVKPAAGQ